MNFSTARIVVLCSAAAAGSMGLMAQMTGPAPDNTSAADSSTKAAMGKSSDKMFLHKASEGGFAEVQLGQLATQKSSSDDVKQFGQKMVDDHTALNDQLKPFAEAKGLTPPTKLAPKDQAEYDKLNGMSSDAFDKEYIAYMVKDHHMDLREFKKEIATTQDSSLKDAVTKGEGVIQQHTEMAEKLAKDKGVMVPMRKGGASTPAAE